MGVSSFLRPNNATMNAERVRMEDEEKNYLNFAALFFSRSFLDERMAIWWIDQSGGINQQKQVIQ